MDIIILNSFEWNEHFFYMKINYQKKKRYYYRNLFASFRLCFSQVNGLTSIRLNHQFN